MKTILKSLSAVCFFAFFATAAHAQLSVGAGYDYSSMRNVIDAEGYEETAFSSHGFYVGVDYNVRLWKGLGVTPGVQYEFTDALVDDGMKFQEHYLNIPVDINYLFKLTDNFGLGVSLVPSFNVGLASELHYDGRTLDVYELAGQFGDALGVKNLYGRFDFMLGVGVSADLFRHFRIKVRYDFGMVNRFSSLKKQYPELLEEVNVHRNRLQVGVAYVF